MSVKVKMSLEHFVYFSIGMVERPLLGESLLISTLSYSRIVSCSTSAFYAFSHSVSKRWHAFCHAWG